MSKSVLFYLAVAAASGFRILTEARALMECICGVAPVLAVTCQHTDSSVAVVIFASLIKFVEAVITSLAVPGMNFQPPAGTFVHALTVFGAAQTCCLHPGPPVEADAISGLMRVSSINWISFGRAGKSSCALW